jgi:hypothetical protein
MSNVRLVLIIGFTVITIALGQSVLAQGVEPYPNAITDRLVHQETPLALPPVGVLFHDPDFGSAMVRVTDQNTNFKTPRGYLRTEASGQANEWSSDTSKFYVVGQGGHEFAFAFDPSTMEVKSLPNAGPGGAFLLPLSPGSTFSFVDPDLIYGTTSKTPLTITSYRFSTGVSKSVIDTTTCGTKPALVFSRQVVSDYDVSLSATDQRISISEGGPESGKDPFVVVYDKTLGCRWYNTETGQIGGQWGPVGSAPSYPSYLIRHAYLSRSGKYVRILVNNFGWYVWDVATLNVTACSNRARGLDCGGYGVGGYNSFINSLGITDGMDFGIRPFSNITRITPLIYPLGLQPQFGQEKHFTWSNARVSDRVPVCVSGYDYEGEIDITEPYDNEIMCVETDGAASTVWRFAHHRAVWQAPFFQTQPLGNVSDDGHFFLFTSGWDKQLGNNLQGAPRSDVWIVKLD